MDDLAGVLLAWIAPVCGSSKRCPSPLTGNVPTGVGSVSLECGTRHCWTEPVRSGAVVRWDGSIDSGCCPTRHIACFGPHN